MQSEHKRPSVIPFPQLEHCTEILLASKYKELSDLVIIPEFIRHPSGWKIDISPTLVYHRRIVLGVQHSEVREIGASTRG